MKRPERQMFPIVCVVHEVGIGVVILVSYLASIALCVEPLFNSHASVESFVGKADS